MPDENFQKSKGVGLQLQLIETDAGSELLDYDENFQISEVQAAKYPLTTIEKDVERLKGIIAALTMDQSLRSIMKRFKVGGHTLNSIQGKYLGEIAAHKERVARKLDFVSELQIDRLIANPDSLDINRAFMTFGTAIDKAAMMRGEATSIHKTINSSEVTPSSFASYLETLKQVGATGSGGVGGEGKKGVAASEEVIDLAIEGGTDKQSV